jgi:hypothetical protein
MIKYLLVFLALLLNMSVMAQSTHSHTDLQANDQPAIFVKLGIEQDPEIVRLVGTHIRNNESVRRISGYRVEIFFSSSLDARQKALETKTTFLRENPDVAVYVLYVSPDFKVRVGDFRTKNEALHLMKKIQGRFPKAFIVPDNIELPSLN